MNVNGPGMNLKRFEIPRRERPLPTSTMEVRSFPLGDSCSLHEQATWNGFWTVMTHYAYLFEARRADLEWKREPNDKSRNQSIYDTPI